MLCTLLRGPNWKARDGRESWVAGTFESSETDPLGVDRQPRGSHLNELRSAKGAIGIRHLVWTPRAREQSGVLSRCGMSPQFHPRHRFGFMATLATAILSRLVHNDREERGWWELAVSMVIMTSFSPPDLAHRA